MSRLGLARLMASFRPGVAPASLRLRGFPLPLPMRALRAAAALPVDSDRLVVSGTLLLVFLPFRLSLLLPVPSAMMLIGSMLRVDLRYQAP